MRMNPWVQGPKFNPAAVSITGGSGVPILLASSFAAVSGAADTAENVLATITIPANTLGANGIIRLYTQWAYTNSVNNKTIRVRFNGGAGTQYLAFVATTTAAALVHTTIANRNATNSQTGQSMVAIASGTIAQAPQTTSADTTAATTIVVSGEKASAGETLTLSGYYVEYIKPTT